MEINLPTAKEAKEKARKIMDDNDAILILKLENKIGNAISNGKLAIQIETSEMPTALEFTKKLKEMGYYISPSYALADRRVIDISWN